MHVRSSLLFVSMLFSCAGATSSQRTSETTASGAPVTVIQQRPARVPGASDAGVTPNGTALVIPDSAPSIPDIATWNILATSPSREISARTEVVKFVIDYADHDRIYFLQTHRWEIHYYFIRQFLARPDAPIPDSEAFWAREYLSNNRRFIQGSITHYRDQNIWAVELIAQDVLDVPRAIAAFENVRSHSNLPGLRYHPIPPHHIAAADAIRARIPVVTTDDIFANTRYQPLNPGEAYGYLRFFDGAVDPARVRPFDIVVLAEVPLDLPVCAGVITAELQTPLSHVAVLSANRGTPNMALRNANHDAALRALDGQLVHLHVTPQEYTVTRATQSEAEASWNAHRPAEMAHLHRSESDPGLPALAAIDAGDIDLVGAKAAQMGALAQITPALPLPRAFALPFRAYLDHLRRNHLDAELTRLLADPQFQNDPTVRERSLAALREHIIAAPVDPALLTRLRREIQRSFPNTRVRFRSSTNAEDLPGFNGAGLYLSTRTEANPTDAQIADALRRVWASTWNFQGFEERTYYRIPQDEVAMGVLVQESIDDDVATGVAITANPFDEGRPGFYINSQVSAGSVTSAGNGEVAEQSIFYTYPPPGALERLSSSSRTNGQPVLTNQELTALSSHLAAIHGYFYGTVPWQTGQSMDVEFIVAGPSRRIVIVQARPFAVRWNEGRTYARDPNTGT